MTSKKTMMMKMMKYLQQNPAQETTSVDAVNCFVKVNAQLSFPLYALSDNVVKSKRSDRYIPSGS